MVDRDKLKKYLETKQSEYEKKIKKLKRKKKIIKCIYTGTIVLSISSSIIASSSMLGIPIIAVTVLGTAGVLSTALSVKLNFKGTKKKIDNIKKLNKIKSKLEYILNCNGDLTDEKCLEIIKEFDNLE